MKNLFKKGAVAAAVAGSLMLSGVASADSLLAPLVIGTNSGSEAAGIKTFFSIKVMGKGKVAENWLGGKGSASNLHYTWFKKGTTLADLKDLTKACTIENSMGYVSSYDMILQTAVLDAPYASNVNSTASSYLDQSYPSSYGSDFVGFAIITDEANASEDKTVKDLVNEGEMAGFGYVIDAANSFVLDYKMLNMHRSKVAGDFSAGFISKKSIDYSWLPVYDAVKNPYGAAETSWLTVVVGDAMTKAELGGKWAGSVNITQKAYDGGVAPTLPTDANPNDNSIMTGVYNNDEKVYSGNKELAITCMGAYERKDFLMTNQEQFTRDGGWRRAAIHASNGATGAITYKQEQIHVSNLAFNADQGESVFGSVSDGKVLGAALNNGIKAGEVVSFQVETSGHLNKTPEPHPNRPY